MHCRHSVRILGVCRAKHQGPLFHHYKKEPTGGEEDIKLFFESDNLFVKKQDQSACGRGS